MAIPPSQRPRRVAPASNQSTSTLPHTKVAAASPQPVVAVSDSAASLFSRSLILILSLSYAAFFILPPIAAALLNSLSADGDPADPARLTTRTNAFFAATYGIFGFAWFTWACCRFSLDRGRTWAWGLLSLLGGVGLITLWMTGMPVAGVFSILALTGLIVPYSLPVDSMELLLQDSRKRKSSGEFWLVAFLLLVGISMAYWNAFRGGMTLDNKYIIEEYYKTLLRQDPHLEVMSGKMLGYIFGNDYWWPKGISGLYRPLVTLSYWANYVYGNNKLDPFQFHVVNFFLHWIAAFFGFLMIRQLTGRTLIAFCAALLFVTHPIATESVSNIIGRADIMAALATFAGAVLYIHSTTAGPIIKWVDLSLLLIVTLLGIFAKESAVAIAGVMVVYDLVYRWTKDDLIEALPTLLAVCIVGAITAGAGFLYGSFGFLGLSEGVLPALGVMLAICVIAGVAIVAYWQLKLQSASLLHPLWAEPWHKFFIAYLFIVPPAIAWILARGQVFHNSSPPETPFLDNPIRGLNFFAARMTASDVFIRLIGLLVWPIKLSCDYSFNQIPLFVGSLRAVDTWLAFAGVLALIALIMLAIVFWRREKTISFLILFYLVVYLPTSNFLIIIGSIMAERFLYLPLLAFTACLVLGIDRLLRKFAPSVSSILTCTLVVLLSLSYCIRTHYRNQDWLTDITLWNSAIKVSPMSFRSYQSDAFALYERYINNENAGVYKTDPVDQQADIDQIIATAEGAKPIVDVLPPKLNSSRLYLHLGMYYSKKGDTNSHPKPDGTLLPGDPSLPWFAKGEQVLQQAVVIDRTFNGVNYDKEIARKIKKPSEIADVGLPPIYFYLGYDYAQLGQMQKALESFIYLSHLDPSDPDSYMKIATVQMRQGRFEDAAASILQAMILNQAVPNAWQQLAAVFSKVQPDGDKALLFQKDNRVQLNMQSSAAKSAMCLAYQNFVRSFLLARRLETAEQFAKAAKNIGFPAALFDDLFTNPNDTPPVPPLPN